MNAEARVKSEGKAGREDPTWNYRGGVIKSLKWNKKCVPETSLKRTVLVRGADATQRRLIGTFRGGRAGGSVLWGSLQGSSADRSPPRALLRPSGVAARRPLSCPPLFSSYPLSFLDSLGCYRPGWRLRHHKAFPPASELSSPRPPPWELGWPGAWGSLLRLSLLAVSSIPDGGMRRATEDISGFPWMWMLHEPSLLIAESCGSKERFLYSY